MKDNPSVDDTHDNDDTNDNGNIKSFLSTLKKRGFYCAARTITPYGPPTALQ